MQNLHRANLTEPALELQRLAQIFAGAKLHDDEVDSVLFANSLNCDAVGMLHHRCGLRLALEAGGEGAVVGQMRVHDLDRDAHAACLEVLARKHTGHRAFANVVGNFVPPGQDEAEERRGRSHREQG